MHNLRERHETERKALHAKHLAEQAALADMAGCGADIKWREPHGGVDHSPFWRVYIPTEELAVEVASAQLPPPTGSVCDRLDLEQVVVVDPSEAV